MKTGRLRRLSEFEYLKGFSQVRIEDYRIPRLRRALYAFPCGAAGSELYSDPFGQLFAKGIFGWRYVQAGFYAAVPGGQFEDQYPEPVPAAAGLQSGADVSAYYAKAEYTARSIPTIRWIRSRWTSCKITAGTM
jgi:hypothetical protein